MVTKIYNNILYNTLTKLLDKKIENFTFVFNKSKIFYCNIKLVRKTVIISFPEIRRHVANCLLYKKRIKHLKRLGFQFYDDRDKLILFLPYTNQEEINKVKDILVQIVFEVFYFKEICNEPFIKYIENSA